MKKRSNSKGKNGVFDFHFIMARTPFTIKFVEEAAREDRSLTAQFRRILEKEYGSTK